MSRLLIVFFLVVLAMIASACQTENSNVGEPPQAGNGTEPTHISAPLIQEWKVQIVYWVAGGFAGNIRDNIRIAYGRVSDASGNGIDATQPNAANINPVVIDEVKAGQIIDLLNQQHFWDIQSPAPPPAMDWFRRVLDVTVNGRHRQLVCYSPSLSDASYFEELMNSIKIICSTS